MKLDYDRPLAVPPRAGSSWIALMSNCSMSMPSLFVFCKRFEKIERIVALSVVVTSVSVGGEPRVVGLRRRARGNDKT